MPGERQIGHRAIAGSSTEVLTHRKDQLMTKYRAYVQVDLSSDTTNATKWDLMTAQVEALEEMAASIKHRLEGLDNTDCGLTCSGCGTYLDTEGDFARHFTVSRHDQMAGRLNLGECGTKVSGK